MAVSAVNKTDVASSLPELKVQKNMGHGVRGSGDPTEYRGDNFQTCAGFLEAVGKSSGVLSAPLKTACENSAKVGAWGPLTPANITNKPCPRSLCCYPLTTCTPWTEEHLSCGGSTLQPKGIHPTTSQTGELRREPRNLTWGSAVTPGWHFLLSISYPTQGGLCAGPPVPIGRPATHRPHRIFLEHKPLDCGGLMNSSKSPKALPHSSDIRLPPSGFCLIFTSLWYPFHISCK